MKLLKVMLLFTFLKATSCTPSLKFGVIADWGGIPIFPYKTFVELSVGRELDYFARNFGIDAILALGDNFYLDGVKNVNDSRFKKTFETAFNYESLHVPWLVIAGNHDHYGNVSAQIAYSSISDRWHFPDLYYKKKFIIPSSNFTVDLIMIDTVLLCGNTNPNYPFKQPHINISKNRAKEKHWQWLDDALKASKSNYLLVCGHFPVYSIGKHGPTNCLVNKLVPLLVKYNVSAYLSGHDHNMQHIQVKNEHQVMDYVVSGSANLIDPSKENLDKIPLGSLQFHWGNPFSLGAFAYLDINPLNMTLAFYLSSGKLLYNFTKQPKYR